MACLTRCRTEICIGADDFTRVYKNKISDFTVPFTLSFDGKCTLQVFLIDPKGITRGKELQRTSNTGRIMSLVYWVNLCVM